ncbi:MAG: aminopeptidase, partial [Acidobacteria bacterium]|nr:aminopeptidase [Acidobacteriota bacterium]
MHESAIDLSRLSFDPEYTPGARNAVHTCLGIRPAERVTLITDEATADIAAALASELQAVGCRWHGFVLETLAPRP